MLAPQQTIMLASVNLRCEGAGASLPTLIFLDFEHPTLQGLKRESMSYPPHLSPQLIDSRKQG